MFDHDHTRVGVVGARLRRLFLRLLRVFSLCVVIVGVAVVVEVVGVKVGAFTDSIMVDVLVVVVRGG